MQLLYTVKRAADELGVSPTTIYRWLAEKELQPAAVDGRIRIIDGASVHALKPKIVNGRLAKNASAN